MFIVSPFCILVCEHDGPCRLLRRYFATGSDIVDADDGGGADGFTGFKDTTLCYWPTNDASVLTAAIVFEALRLYGTQPFFCRSPCRLMKPDADSRWRLTTFLPPPPAHTAMVAAISLSKMMLPCNV